jgi:hypothetical protein
MKETSIPTVDTLYFPTALFISESKSFEFGKGFLKYKVITFSGNLDIYFSFMLDQSVLFFKGNILYE